MINVVRDWIFPIVFGGVVLFGLWAVVMAFIVARRQQRAGLAGRYQLQTQASAAAYAAASGNKDSDEARYREMADQLAEGADPHNPLHPSIGSISGRLLLPGELDLPGSATDYH